MGVLINRKRCDNADACPCIAGCPAKAFYFDTKEKRVSVDNDFCINCRKCMLTCEAGAVKVYRTDEEKTDLETEYDRDTMTEEKLFQERFGATSIDEKNLLKLECLDDLIAEENKDLLIEFYSEDEANCLINSIPIADIKECLTKEVSYRKIDVSNLEQLEKYEIDALPALILFSKNKVIFKHTGVVDCKDKDILLEAFKNI